MNKKLLFTALFLIAAVAVIAQNSKPAVITGYAPDVKDGTVVLYGVEPNVPAQDTVKNGRFKLVVPIEKFTEGIVFFFGPEAPKSNFTVYLTPGLEINIDGTKDKFPFWTFDSPIAEQATYFKINELVRDSKQKYLEAEAKVRSREEYERLKPLQYEWDKQLIDALPKVPIDRASVIDLRRLSQSVQIDKNFPYVAQVKQLVKNIKARAPKEFDEDIAEAERMTEPCKMVNVGDKAVDTDFMDLQGNHHTLSEIKDKYILLDFWALGCGACMMSEPEMKYIYNQLKDKLEIVSISSDKISTWKENEFSKSLVWKNWNDGKRRSGIEQQYNDVHAIPFYVLLSPDHKVIWKTCGYYPGNYLGMMSAIKAMRQDNSKNLSLAVTKVEANKKATTVHFKFYGMEPDPFKIVKASYLTANGKKYQLKSANGITLDEWTKVDQKVVDLQTMGNNFEIKSKEFSLTFEPFDKVPASFTYKEGDENGAFVISNIATK